MGRRAYHRRADPPLLGIRCASIVGHAVEGGYALWAVIVQLASLAIGAALAARISHANDSMGGGVAGVMTWAVALVVGGAMQGATALQRFEGTGVWAPFLGAALGLGAAIVGGVFGASLGRSRPVSSASMGPSHSQPVG